MIDHVYTIYDRVAEDAGPLFTARNEGVALRALGDVFKNSYGKPEEYKLLCIGTYDHTTAKLESIDPPIDIYFDPGRFANV